MIDEACPHPDRLQIRRSPDATSPATWFWRPQPRRLGGWLAIAALCSNGCSVAITYGGPKRRVVRYETRSQTATIRTVPSGATLTAGQAPPHVTPTDLEASYQVKLVHEERRELYAWLGLGAAAATLGTGALVLGASENRDSKLGWGILMLGVLDLCSYANRFASFRRANERARLRAREFPVERPLDVVVRWNDTPPQPTTVRWPQRFITIVRARPTTFDEALIAWAEAGDRTPSAEGLFNLGSAYAARATANGDAGDRRKALDYLGRYLNTGEVSEPRRGRVEELRRALGSP